MQTSPLSPRSTAWRWLGEHPDDAAELAALLHEAAPKLGLKGDYPVSRRVTPSFPAKTTLRRDEADPEDLGQLLQQAVPIPTGETWLAASLMRVSVSRSSYIWV